MISRHILDDHKATLKQLVSYVWEIFFGRKNLCDDNIHSWRMLWHIKNANRVNMGLKFPTRAEKIYTHSIHFEATFKDLFYEHRSRGTHCNYK